MNLPVLMAVPERQRERADRLAQYCWALDRTHVHWIVMTAEEDKEFEAQYPENRFHSLQSYGLHRVSLLAEGAFIWLEVDAIPLKEGWARKLSEEYWYCRKKFLISSDSNPPFDLVGGIGVYPPETSWLVPYHFPKSGWDMWLLEAVPHLVARTKSLQHSYGIYNELGQATEHRFPRDNKILRPDAVIFHRDPHQDLLARK